MARWWWLFSLLFCLLLGPQPAQAAPAPAKGPVVVLTLAGPINPVAAAYIERGVKEAEAVGAQALVIELDTPGGLDEAMRSIIQDMVASRVPVVVYVAPHGARAASAGMFITVAAHVAAMAPDTAIGAAHPVGGGGEEIKGPMGDKITNDAAAYVRGLASERGRNVKWVEDAVRKSVSVSSAEALRLDVIDLVATSTPALLDALDGREVKVLGNAVVLRTADAETRPLPMHGGERFLYTLANPSLALILLNLGVLGIIFELQNPGGFVAGIAGVLCLLLGLFALGMIPINGTGVALMAFGLLLLVAEVFVPSFGLLAIGGVVAMALGAVMLFNGQAPGLAPSLPFILTVTIGTGALVLLAGSFALKAQRRRATTGREEIIGRVGEVRSELAPVGMVFLEGELWSAEATEGSPIAVGESVVVTRLQGLKLFVTRRQSFQGK